MSKIRIMKRKVSDETMVWEAQRMIQRELLSVDCSVDIRPRSFNGKKISDKVLPVAVITVSDVANLSAVNSAVYSVVGEFNLCGSVSRNADVSGFTAYVYKRKSDALDAMNVPAITLRDVVEDVRSLFKRSTNL